MILSPFEFTLNYQQWQSNYIKRKKKNVHTYQYIRRKPVFGSLTYKIHVVHP